MVDKGGKPRSPADVPASAADLKPLDQIVEGQPVEESHILGLDLAGRKLCNFSVKCSILEKVSFAGCQIPAARLRDVRLVKCDLSNAVVRGFHATRVEFVDCRLTGMIAIECRWQDVLVENCDGRYAQLQDARIQSCEFIGGNFSEADFRTTHLDHTRFTRCDLTRADLSQAKLHGTDLRGAEIGGIVVGPADVRGAIVSAAQALELSRLLGIVIK